MKTDSARDKYLTEISKATLKSKYLLDGENFQEAFARVAKDYSHDLEHAQRIYDYISNLWFMPATPILISAGSKKGLPISCFLNEIQDSIDGLSDKWRENIYMAAKGGGIGTCYSNVRSIGEKVNGNGGKTSGIIPFIKVQDSLSAAISQGGYRRGSSAAYLDISHPEIFEFIDIRRPTDKDGGDQNRRCLNVHHGVTIGHDFMVAVKQNSDWDLISPKTGETIQTVKARELWIKLLVARLETGEPYIMFKDTVNNHRTEIQSKLGLEVKTSNLCVAPETLILTKEHGHIPIETMENKKVHVWNGIEWSETTVRKTSNNSELIKVTFSDDSFIECTKEHKFYIQNKHGEKPKIVKAIDLKQNDKLEKFNLPTDIKPKAVFDENAYSKGFYSGDAGRSIKVQSIVITGRKDKTYCFTEPKRNKGVFNGILTGNCNEIMLPTGIDYLNKDRSAVCCLSSLNLEKFDEWESHPTFIEDVMLFLDNVLQKFIDNAPEEMRAARYAAEMERSVGLGVMGLHSYFQSKMIPFDSFEAKLHNKAIFKHIKTEVDKANVAIAKTKGACPDALATEVNHRFSNCTAIAPTASISLICGTTSPSIEPWFSNCFNHKNLNGSATYKNIHLTKILNKYGMDTEEVWDDIKRKSGSVQHLPNLTQEEKEVFKTAFEINQKSIVTMAADRQQFIDQGQSVNIFLPADIHKKDLVKIHLDAWELGLKGLYYCRSTSVLKAESYEYGKGECSACQ